MHCEAPRTAAGLAFGDSRAHSREMRDHFDQTDYSVVVKNRGRPPNSWRWEIYRAGRSSPIEQSTVYFSIMGLAHKEGKQALKRLLDKLRLRPLG